MMDRATQTNFVQALLGGAMTAPGAPLAQQAYFPQGTPGMLGTPAPVGQQPPMQQIALTPDEVNDYHRRINDAEGDEDLEQIKRELDASGIDTGLIPALRGVGGK